MARKRAADGVMGSIPIRVLEQSIDRLQSELETTREEHQHVAESLEERTWEARLLREVAEAANLAATPEQAFRIALRLICDHGGWRGGHVYIKRLRGDGTIVLEPSNIWHAKAGTQFRVFRDSTMGTSFGPGEGLIGRVYRNREPEWISDLHRDPGFLRTVDESLHAAAAFPVLVEDEAVAVIELFSEKVIAPKGAFLQIMANVGTQLGRVIERDRAASVLQSSEARFRLLMDSLSDYAIMILDDEGRIVTWNASAQRLYGYTEDQILGRHFGLFYPPGETRAGLPRRLLGQALAAGRVEDEGWRTRRDGVRFWANSMLTALVDASGNRHGFVKIVRDMSERRRLEREVLEIAERERRRIGAELHDSIMQQLTGGAMLAESLRRKIARGAAVGEREVAKIVQMLKEAQEQTRYLHRGLMPVQVDAEGLMNALGSLAERTSTLHGVVCRFRPAREVLLEDNRVATHLFKIAQEAVHNAIKHADSTRIYIELSADGEIGLAIRDNGTGFEGDVEEREGSGIRIMQYRATMIGGKLDIVSERGKGTRVTCTVAVPSIGGEGG